MRTHRDNSDFREGFERGRQEAARPIERTRPSLRDARSET